MDRIGRDKTLLERVQTLETRVGELEEENKRQDRRHGHHDERFRRILGDEPTEAVVERSSI